ncbi:iron-containing alcohol dehydrogenase [Actinomadura keratinilytica]|uniref:Iron-containing alcohol dehydrogenase n=1 Tax=Actinomadura keratinilytica TaxID=547461 RepID=A0ABP7Z162_9ACTN
MRGSVDAVELAGPRTKNLEAVPARTRVAKNGTPEIVFGPGALGDVGTCALRCGARRPFLVTDPGLIEAGWIAEAVGHLRLSGLRPVVWHDITPNPKDHEVEAAYAAYRDSACDLVIGLGGGSCIDAAKSVAILAGNGGRILDYEGVDRVTRPLPVTMMVPSTSGTGSDVTQFAVITDTVHLVKAVIISEAVVPDISIIDPRLLTTMPEWLNAATGLDALTHGIESFVSRAHSPLTDRRALDAVRLVARHLDRTMDRPEEAGSRMAMAQGALEAGMAFTSAILGATHAMSHQVGGLLDAPHGVINGVLLPHVIRFNARVDPGRYVPLAAAAGVDVGRCSPEDAAYLLADKVERLADAVGVPSGLRAVGLTEEAIPRLAATTLKDACMATNPRQATQADVERLFREAL